MTLPSLCPRLAPLGGIIPVTEVTTEMVSNGSRLLSITCAGSLNEGVPFPAVLAPDGGGVTVTRWALEHIGKRRAAAFAGSWWRRARTEQDIADSALESLPGRLRSGRKR